MKVSLFEISILIILILFQSLCAMLLGIKEAVNSIGGVISTFNYPRIIELTMTIIGVSAIAWVIYIVKLIRNHEDDVKKLNHSTSIIEALRGQKHDFNNHLNVIAGMIQMNKAKKALDYIQKIGGKTNEIFSISKIENVEIAAILYSKYAIAESKGIEIELDIDSSLGNLKIDSIEISRVLFNLIDNAIHELIEAREDRKRLSIDISEDISQYIISICNSYPVIPRHLYDKIFEKGYTTKEDNESQHGYGLYIVKNIIQKNKGKITVESYEGLGTIFTIFLPKKVAQRDIVNVQGANT